MKMGTKKVEISLTQEVRDKLSAIANDTGIGVATVIKIAIKKYLDEIK